MQNLRLLFHAEFLQVRFADLLNFSRPTSVRNYHRTMWQIAKTFLMDGGQGNINLKFS